MRYERNWFKAEGSRSLWLRPGRRWYRCLPHLPYVSRSSLLGRRRGGFHLPHDTRTQAIDFRGAGFPIAGGNVPDVFIVIELFSTFAE